MHPPRRRGRRTLRIAAGSFAALVIVFLLAAGGAVVFFDPNSLKPRIVAAVKRETGRDIAINGRIGLSPSLTPTIRATDITLSNLPDGSSQTMLSVGRAEAQISILPLLYHRLVINRLILQQTSLLLERTSTGERNWIFRRPTQAAPSVPVSASPSASAADGANELRIAIKSVHLRDGEVRLHDVAGFPAAVIAVPRIDATSASLTSPIAGHAELTVGGVDLSADATMGSLARLQDRLSTAAWPFNVTVTGTGLRFAAAGEMTKPAEGRGYSATVDLDFAEDNPFHDAINKVVPLRDLRILAQVADTESGAAAWTKMSVRGAGTGDVSALADLKVATLNFTADTTDDPIRADVRGSYRDGAFTLGGTLPSPTAMFAASRGGPFPMDLTTQYAGAQLHAKGVIGSYTRLADANIRVDLAIPDLITLSKAMRILLPSVRDVSLGGRITDADTTFMRGIALRDLKLTSPNGTLSGEVEATYSGRPNVRASLSSDKFDVTGLSALFRALQPAQDAGSPGTPASSSTRAPDNPRSPAEAAARANLPPPPPDIRLTFSNKPFPTGFIQRNDLDIAVSVADLRAGGADYTNFVGHLFARDGQFTVDPLTASTPNGKMDARLAVDASVPATGVMLTLRAPALPAALMMSVLALPDDATGTVDIDVNLAGAGATPHDLASSLNGNAVVSISDAEIDNRLLTAALGEAMRGARLPDSFGTGRTRLRCFALRADASGGVVKVPMIVMDTPSLMLQGTGDVNLNDERLTFRVRPTVRIGGPALSVPMRISGTLSAPRGSVDALAAIAGFGEKDRGGDPCPAALASLRSTPAAVAAPAAGGPARPTARGSKG